MVCRWGSTRTRSAFAVDGAVATQSVSHTSRFMRLPRRAGWVLPVLVDKAQCLACCLKSSDALAGLLPRPRRVSLRKVFPDPGFQDGSGTPDGSHQHQPERPHGRPHASHSERALEGPRIRFSYQGGLRLASNAPGCASSPLHPCDVTVTSPDCGSSPVRPSRAAPWQDLDTCSPIDRLTGHFLPAATCPRRPHLRGLVGQWSRRGHCSPQRSVAAAVTL